jgi:hypothetical protein
MARANEVTAPAQHEFFQAHLACSYEDDMYSLQAHLATFFHTDMSPFLL